MMFMSKHVISLFCQIRFKARNFVPQYGGNEKDERSSSHCFYQSASISFSDLTEKG